MFEEENDSLCQVTAAGLNGGDSNVNLGWAKIKIAGDGKPDQSGFKRE